RPRQGLRGRRRGVADLHRGAEGFSFGVVGTRQRLRLSGRAGRRGRDARQGVDRRRPVRPQQPARPAALGVRRQRHAARRPAAPGASPPARHPEQPSKPTTMSYREKSEVRDGMRIDWDMPITANDGLVLRCDVFRPIKPGRYPVILSYGPYGKWLHFEDGYKTAWDRMVQKHPSVTAGS